MKVPMPNRFFPAKNPLSDCQEGLLLWILAICGPGLVFRIDSSPGQLIIGLHIVLVVWMGVGALVMLGKACRKQRTENLCIGAGFWLLVPLGLVAGTFWPGATGLIWILGGAAFLARLFPLRMEASSSSFRISECVAVLLIFTLLFTLTGTWHTHAVGQHTGDEGHYLVQAESLLADGDLDIRNQLPGATNRDKINFHISPNARNNAWYSWHTPGLSFLLVPVLNGPIWLRHLLLGFLAGLGIAGLYACCRIRSVNRSLSLTGCLFMGCSVFYGVYASRALPETAGAALLNLGFLAVLLQHRMPFRSALITILCVGALPWLQSRFLPPALVIMGMYGLEGLLRKEPFRQRLLLLIPFTLGCLFLLAGYQPVGLKFKNCV